MRSREAWLYLGALGGLLLFAFIARLYVAVALPNIVWPDEIFQSLEQGHRAAFGNGIVPWEFREGIRSWILPGTLAAIMAASWTITESVTAYLVACAGALALLSLLPVWVTFKEAFQQAGLRAALVAGLFVALWFELIYFAPKALSEVVAGNLLGVAAILGGACLRDAREETPIPRGRVIAFAFTASLAAMLRIHLAVAALVLFAVVFFKLPRQARWWMVGVGAAVVLLAGLVDLITWGSPFHSYLANVRVNVVEDKSSRYGIAPWYAYFVVNAKVWGVWGIGIIALAAVGARRWPLLGVCALLVIASHIPIAHKEYRFAYPAMLLVIMLAALGAATLVTWIDTHRGARMATLTAVGLVTAWFAASASGAASFHASKTQLAYVWHEEQDHWIRRRGGLIGMQRLGEDPNICGVGLAGIGWGDTGGYTHLHRDVPIFPFPNQQMLWKYVPHFNGLLITPGRPAQIGPFTVEQCWEDACLYRRPGTCEPIEHDINKAMERMRQ